MTRNALNTDSERQCSTCREVKPVPEGFYRSSSAKSGWQSNCKVCAVKHSTDWSRNNVEESSRKTWKYRLRDFFGMTEGDYWNLLESQGGGCAICGKTPDLCTRRMAVDHCHESGLVRGILCPPCNTGLGLFKDDKDLLRRAIGYLKDEK